MFGFRLSGEGLFCKGLSLSKTGYLKKPKSNPFSDDLKFCQNRSTFYVLKPLKSLSSVAQIQQCSWACGFLSARFYPRGGRVAGCNRKSAGLYPSNPDNCIWFPAGLSVGKLGNQVEIVVQCLMVIVEGNLFKIK